MPDCAPKLADDVLSDLRAAAGDGAVAISESQLDAYARDLWPKLTVQLRDGQPAARPAAVVRPRDEAAVLRVLQVAARHAVPVVPYGAGSGVCGGAAAVAGCLMLDVKSLDSFGNVDAGSMQVDCGPGLVVQTMERRLNDAGWTLGHFPSSIACCSIGGAVAARGAGQLSSRYGKIEDMLTGLRVATPGLGLIATGSLDRSGDDGPDWSPFFAGSEGALGVITAIRLRVCPLPQRIVLRGVRFPNVSDGIDGFRQILQAGLRPSVMRLYDPLDTWMALQGAGKGDDEAQRGPPPRPGGGDPLAGGARERGPEPRGAPAPSASGAPGGLRARLKEMLKPEALPVDRFLASPSLLNRGIGLLPDRCLGILGCEGDEATAREQLDAAVAAARRVGALDLGEGPGLRWFRRRYHVSFKLPKLLAQGGFADTFETAAPWSRVEALYDSVRAAVAPHALVMAHMSHAYHEGCSIYFTLVGYAKDSARIDPLYRRTWDAAMDAALRVGATLTHHHGVGLLKRDFMDREHGDGRRFWDAARTALDPSGILNPGKVFRPERPPPGPPAERPEPRALRLPAAEDGRAEAGTGWRGADLAAELALRGHFLPPLGRAFLRGTVGDWLRSPAWPAHVAVHGAWEHPLLSVEGRFADGRAWRSGMLPRSAAGPSWLPFGVATGAAADSGGPGTDGRGSLAPPGVEAVLVSFRTLSAPHLRLAGYRFPTFDAAAAALSTALRGSIRPLAGGIYPGPRADGHRRVLQDAPGPREPAVLYLALPAPDGFPRGPGQPVERLRAAGGEPLSDEDALHWWEDHWAWPAREGAVALPSTGPLPDEAAIGSVSAVVAWGRACALLRAVETLTGGPTRAAGWMEAPLETGCTLVWRFASSRAGEPSSPLVGHQIRETIRSHGARLAAWDLAGTATLPPEAFRGDRSGPSDAVRLARRVAEALASA